MPEHTNDECDAPSADAWLSVEEIGTMLGRSPRTIRRWIAAGDLPALRIRGTTRVRITALAALVK
jgi:excisionase family DNA binding protein